VQKRLADGWRAEQKAADRQKATDEALIKPARPQAPNEEPPAKPVVTAALGSLPPAASLVPKAPVVEPPAATTPSEVNTPRQIKKAQQELRRLACFMGPADGKLDRKTEQALKDYWKKTRQDIAEVKITDGFIAELEEQDEEVCRPVRKPPAVASQPPPKQQPARPRQVVRDSPAPRVIQQPAATPRSAPRPAEDQHAKATASGGGTTLFLGVGH
jgi:hypothetical protein